MVPPDPDTAVPARLARAVVGLFVAARRDDALHAPLAQARHARAQLVELRLWGPADQRAYERRWTGGVPLPD